MLVTKKGSPKRTARYHLCTEIIAGRLVSTRAYVPFKSAAVI
jgi:hypothetical protein